MQDIADRAGINKALVHYYFRSKDRLFERVFEYIFSTYLSQIGAAVAEAPDFRSSLKSFIDTYIDLIAANPVVFNFVFRQLTSPGSAFRERAAKLLATTPSNPAMAFQKQLQDAIARGEVRNMDPGHAFISLLGSCVFSFIAYPIFAAMEPSPFPDRAAYLAERKQHIFDFVYHGMQPDRDSR